MAICYLPGGAMVRPEFITGIALGGRTVIVREVRPPAPIDHVVRLPTPERAAAWREQFATEVATLLAANAAAVRH